MKLVLLLAVSCLVLHNGKGAPRPRTAVYKFMKCNPKGDQANCVTLQTPEMAWSPDLPAKLPASEAENLEAEPELEGENAPMEEKEDAMMGEEGESPFVYPIEEGSGIYEGSAAEYEYMADNASPAERETGSGESWKVSEVELYKDGRADAMRSPPTFILTDED